MMADDNKKELVPQYNYQYVEYSYTGPLGEQAVDQMGQHHFLNYGDWRHIRDFHWAPDVQALNALLFGSNASSDIILLDSPIHGGHDFVMDRLENHIKANGGLVQRYTPSQIPNLKSPDVRAAYTYPDVIVLDPRRQWGAGNLWEAITVDTFTRITAIADAATEAGRSIPKVIVVGHPNVERIAEFVPGDVTSQRYDLHGTHYDLEVVREVLAVEDFPQEFEEALVDDAYTWLRIPAVMDALLVACRFDAGMVPGDESVFFRQDGVLFAKRARGSDVVPAMQYLKMIFSEHLTPLQHVLLNLPNSGIDPVLPWGEQ